MLSPSKMKNSRRTTRGIFLDFLVGPPLRSSLHNQVSLPLSINDLFPLLDTLLSECLWRDNVEPRLPWEFADHGDG